MSELLQTMSNNPISWVVWLVSLYCICFFANHMFINYLKYKQSVKSAEYQMQQAKMQQEKLVMEARLAVEADIVNKLVKKP